MKRKTGHLPKFWQSYETSFRNGLPTDIDEVNFVALDTETTGFHQKKDRILSIGALRLVNNEIKAKDAFEVFLNQSTFNSSTVEIHGIRRKGSLERLTELEGLKILLKLLENAVIVAHHTAFDVGMINAALNRNGMPKLINPSVDTALLYNKTLRRSERKTEGNFSLDHLAEVFSIAKPDRHTALGDAYITAIAFMHIIEKLKPISPKQLLKKDRFWEFWKF